MSVEKLGPFRVRRRAERTMGECWELFHTTDPRRKTAHQRLVQQVEKALAEEAEPGDAEAAISVAGFFDNMFGGDETWAGLGYRIMLDVHGAGVRWVAVVDALRRSKRTMH